MLPAAISPVPWLLGIPWMDPQWLLDHFHTEFVWVSLLIVFIECGLFFPFLPGDTLLFAVGVFVAGQQLQLNLGVAVAVFVVAAFAGNVVGYEIGRFVGPPLYERDGRILKRRYFDQTHEFFDKHGKKALVIGRFVPFVRTYITVVAGVTSMARRRFLAWSAVGAVLWVVAITLLGYFLGQAVPWLATNIDLAVLGLLVLSVIPVGWEWWRRRGERTRERASQRV
ncbi:MAG TPA: VTT domain-containing protein [Nocardioidaceae bacterium]|nr:VTT domain-containing protein [Nocardioidaceae bacterium]